MQVPPKIPRRGSHAASWPHRLMLVPGRRTAAQLAHKVGLWVIIASGPQGEMNMLLPPKSRDAAKTPNRGSDMFSRP